jgi:transposase
VAAAAVRVVRTVGSDGSPTVRRVVQGSSMGEAPPLGPRRARRPRQVGLVPLRDRLGEHAGPEKGELTGPNPVDRGKYGSKVHLITERTGLPLSVGISGANLHDSQALIPLVKGIPPIRSRRGRRRRRPGKLHADKGYDYDHLRRWLRERGIRHRIARKGIESSTRLGRHRWTIERTMSWLAGCRRLHRRYERKAEHFLAFTSIACTLICYRRLTK